MRRELCAIRSGMPTLDIMRDRPPTFLLRQRSAVVAPWWRRALAWMLRRFAAALRHRWAS